MKNDREPQPRPSRRNEIVYSRTYLMYLVPLAVVFTIVWISAATYLALGLLRGDGEATFGGGFVTVLSLPIVWIAWKNARSAVKDRNIQKHQLR